MIKRAAVVAIAGAIASPAIAQNEATPPPTVEVIGIGTVKSPPDIARLSFDIRGEGTTADKATQALVDRQKDVVDALTGLLGSAPIAIHTSGMKIEASRSPDCKGDDDYSDQPRLSTGPCAILGYVAGVSIDVPLAHKDALYVRSHYDTVTVTFGDAPSPEEVLVIFAVATRGRPNARVGGLKASDIEGLDGLK